MASTRQRIHILGLGSIGNFAAHCLATLADAPPITLLLHRRTLQEEFERKGKSILLRRYEGGVETAYGFDSEYLDQGVWHHGRRQSISNPELQTTDTISQLLVCTKTIQTVDAVRPLVPRLSAASTILLLQNGCGVIDALNAELFRDERTRPNYIIGVTSHGVGMDGSFCIRHTGPSATSFGPVPRVGTGAGEFMPSNLARTQEYLLETLCRSNRLNAKSYTFAEAFQAQLEKLAVNAFCNPLCGIHAAKNRFLFCLPATRRAILTEISAIVLAMPELEGIRELPERFSVESLERTVNGVLHNTRDTTCSMVWDLKHNRNTEVRFINGYWQRRGKELGIATPVNDMLLELITLRETRSLPVERSD